MPVLQAPRYSCPSTAMLEGRRVLVACVSRLHCPQVTHKPEVRRLFAPSVIRQSPSLNSARLADRPVAALVAAGLGLEPGCASRASRQPGGITGKPWRCSRSQFQVNFSSCPLHAQGHAGDCTDLRGGSTP